MIKEWAFSRQCSRIRKYASSGSDTTLMDSTILQTKNCTKSRQPSLVYINTRQCRCMLVSGVLTQFALIKISYVWHAYSTTTRRHTFTTSSLSWPLRVCWAPQRKYGGAAGIADATGSTRLIAAIRTGGRKCMIHTRSVHSTSNSNGATPLPAKQALFPTAHSIKWGTQTTSVTEV